MKLGKRLFQRVHGRPFMDFLMDGHERRALPPHVTLHASAFLDKFAPDFFKTCFPQKKSEGAILADAVVCPDGMVFDGLHVHPSSPHYNQFSWTAYRKNFPCRRTATKIEEACLVAPQVIHQGSFGDYWIEFLTTLCGQLPPPGSLILIVDDWIERFASEDLEELGYRWQRVPKNGLRVARLHLLPPVQYFDNYTAAAIRDVRAAFPRRVSLPAPGAPKKAYLSRQGFKRLARIPKGLVSTFDNEPAVEAFLASRGYDIILPHQMTNEEVRAALAGVDVLVAAHGAALFHIAWQPPRVLVELVDTNWFLPTFLKLGNQLSLQAHHVLVSREGGLPIPELEDILNQEGG